MAGNLYPNLKEFVKNVVSLDSGDNYLYVKELSGKLVHPKVFIIVFLAGVEVST